MAIVMASTLAIAEKKKQAAPDDGAQAQHLKAMDVMALKYDAAEQKDVAEHWAAAEKRKAADVMALKWTAEKRTMDVMALKYDAGQKWESWAAKKKYRGWC